MPGAIHESEDLERHRLGKGRGWLTRYHKLCLHRPDQQLLGVQGGSARRTWPRWKPVLRSRPRSFPAHQGACCCQAGRPPIGWEEGRNPNCLLYLSNQGSRWIAGSERRCLGGVGHLCLSSCLPGAGARGSFPGQNRASVPPPSSPLAPSPPRRAGVAPCQAGQRSSTDN